MIAQVLYLKVHGVLLSGVLSRVMVIRTGYISLFRVLRTPLFWKGPLPSLSLGEPLGAWGLRLGLG